MSREGQVVGMEESGLIPVLLLKTRSTPDDSYEDFFSSSSFSPVFVPVLEHKTNTINLQKIRTLLVEGKLLSQYGGLIFTSQRAVEAFAMIVGDIERNPSQKPSASTASSTFPLYTVGPATSRTLKTLLSSSSTLQLYSCEILGEDTGNGENLAKYILSHYNSIPKPSTASKLGLLFLVGEQRRDIIPKTLTNQSLPESERIGVDEVVVYETGVMETFPEDFERHIASSRQQNSEVVSVVVFSPSGCEAMLLSLGYIDLTGKLTKHGQKTVRWPSATAISDKGEDALGLEPTGSERPRYCIVSIGPTTRDYLFNKWGFEVDVCAEKPSPEGVGQGITRFLQDQGLAIPTK